jgi:hypothetical protein
MKNLWTPVRTVLSHTLRLLFVAAPVAASPVGSSLLKVKTQHLPLVWPPVGSLVVYAVPLASVVIGLFGWVLPRQFTKRTYIRLRSISVFAALLLLFSYFYLVSKYVKEVPTPYNGLQYRTIGSERAPVDDTAFPPGTSDVDLLRKGGLDDGSIERMWTPSSVLHVRLWLLVTYVLCLSMVNFSLSSYGGATSMRRPAAKQQGTP